MTSDPGQENLYGVEFSHYCRQTKGAQGHGNQPDTGEQNQQIESDFMHGKVFMEKVQEA